jgi:hypothetical protein
MLLVLWDIDHTLTENHGVNKEIYAYAFELLTGLRAEHEAQADGRTEPEIMQNMPLAHGLEPTPAHFKRMHCAGRGQISFLLICGIRARPGPDRATHDN